VPGLPYIETTTNDQSQTALQTTENADFGESSFFLGRHLICRRMARRKMLRQQGLGEIS